MGKRAVYMGCAAIIVLCSAGGVAHAATPSAELTLDPEWRFFIDWFGFLILSAVFLKLLVEFKFERLALAVCVPWSMLGIVGLVGVASGPLAGFTAAVVGIVSVMILFGSFLASRALLADLGWV